MFTNINELVELPEMIRGGFIMARPHPTHPLTIYNYTNRCAYGKVWNEATLSCRGLIVDDRGNVVARPFVKFWNLSEVSELPSEPFEVFEKLDGSLGILYWIDGRPFIASRGSFDSEHAKDGTSLLGWLYPHVRFDPAYTYIFEIIHPRHKIVVDYKGRKELVLLAAIHTETGKELNRKELKQFPCLKPRTYAYDSLDELKNLPWQNFEGFVVRFESGLRVKVKLEEYLRLHKLLTGTSEKTILEDWLMEGRDVQQLLDRVPDEFADWVRQTLVKFENEFFSISCDANVWFSRAPKWGTRREFAEFALKTKFPGLLFNMLDGKDTTRGILKMIQADTRKFRCDE